MGRGNGSIPALQAARTIRNPGPSPAVRADGWWPFGPWELRNYPK